MQRLTTPRLCITLPADVLERLDAWRDDHPDWRNQPPPRSTAIAMLLDAHLPGKRTPPKPPNAKRQNA
jgi:hypothetical protein